MRGQHGNAGGESNNKRQSEIGVLPTSGGIDNNDGWRRTGAETNMSGGDNSNDDNYDDSDDNDNAVVKIAVATQTRTCILL